VTPIFPFLLDAFPEAHEETILDICATLSSICGGDQERIQAVLDAEFLPTLIEILTRRPKRSRGQSNTNLRAQASALGVIGNILCGDESQIQAVLDSGILTILSRILDQGNSGVINSVWDVLFNLLRGTSTQLQLVMKTELFPKMFNVMKYSSAHTVKCCSCLAKLTSMKDLSFSSHLIVQGLIPYLVKNLEPSGVDDETLPLVLSVIENLLDTDQSLHELVDEGCRVLLEELAHSPPPDLIVVLEKIMVTLNAEVAHSPDEPDSSRK
jgi:hypothetical protein